MKSRVNINEFDQIVWWPKKPSDKKLAIHHLSAKFEYGKIYTEKEISFDPMKDIIFNKNKAVLNQSNRMKFTAYTVDRKIITQEYISIGGGFIIKEGENKYTMEFNPKDLYVGRFISNTVYIFLLLIACFTLYKSRVKNVQL